MYENRRSSTRFNVELPATVEVDGEALEGVIRNLSLGGAFVALPVRAAMNQRVQVSFRVPTHEQLIVVGAAVRWIAEEGIGVQFDGLRAREVWSLNNYFDGLAE